MLVFFLGEAIVAYYKTENVLLFGIQNKQTMHIYPFMFQHNIVFDIMHRS